MSPCQIVDLTQDAGRFCEPFLRAVNRGRAQIEPDLTQNVAAILHAVRTDGWHAALELTRKFDAPKLQVEQFLVGGEELAKAEVTKVQHDAILKSIDRVAHFHKAQLKALTEGWKQVQLASGRQAWEWRTPATDLPNAGFEGQRLIALDSVGVYAPGGKANYPSSVIMNAVPGLVAGVRKVLMCTPPRPDGSISPAVLVAARELGISTIAKCGGAQAIGLMALGPFGEGGSPPNLNFFRVDKVVGPGNKWVNEAKRQLWGQVGLDTFAGPSEVCVVADESADPEYAAADWLSQVEHAEDNVGYVVATSHGVAESIMAAAERQLSGAPREGVMREALRSRGCVFIVNTAERAAVLASELAAEHVSLLVANPEQALRSLTDGGCALLGPHTPQSAGDFCSGPSHTLPTGGAARFGSPVNVMDFLKFQSISSLTREDLRELLPTIEAFGEMEGFPQHARGASIRFDA